MKWISWNVNGLRACMSKGFVDFLKQENPDVIALQETKMQPHQADFEFSGYHMIWNSAQKPGYSGTAILTKILPRDVQFGIGFPKLDIEGRCITLTYQDLYFVTVYTPNSQEGLKRLETRMKWDDLFREYVVNLAAEKPVIICGDMNVAHNEIDLKNPSSNHMNAGFSDEERSKFGELLNSGYVDTFRYLYPDLKDQYTWWSYRFHAREKNAGWRIDYFLINKPYINLITDHIIYAHIAGSDHCPIGLITEGLCL